ncbi:MAG: hypothetical protein AAFQ82_10205 [Myxococcota bacterium]
MYSTGLIAGATALISALCASPAKTGSVQGTELMNLETRLVAGSTTSTAVLKRLPKSATEGRPFVVYAIKGGRAIEGREIVAPQGHKFCDYSDASVLAEHTLWTCVQSTEGEEAGFVAGYDLRTSDEPVLLRVRYPAPTLFGPMVPTALHVHRGTLFVGLPGRVLTYRNGGAALEELYTFENSHGRKEVDAIVSSDTHLVAVDDVMTPKYLFTFRLDPASSSPTHAFSQELRTALNLTYRGAAIAEESLALRWTTHSRGGASEAIELFALNAAEKRFDPVAVNEVRWRRDEPDTRPDWRGPVWVEGALFVVSPERGVERLNRAGAELQPIAEHDGAFSDIKASGSHALALKRGKAGTELVQLSGSPSQLRTVCRYP